MARASGRTFRRSTSSTTCPAPFATPGAFLLDLIPHVYSGRRVIRVMGEDGKPRNVQLGNKRRSLTPRPASR